MNVEISCSLERLGKEPELLVAEQDILKRQCQVLFRIATRWGNPTLHT